MVITCRRCHQIAAVEAKTRPPTLCPPCRPLAALERRRDYARDHYQERRGKTTAQRDAQAAAALLADPRCSWASAWVIKRRTEGVDILATTP